MNYPKSLEEFFTRDSKWSTELSTLREIILSTGLEEKLKWGFPCYCLKNKNIVGLGDFKSYFGIWFFQGGLLADKAKVLMNAQEGKTKAMRQWRMQQGAEINEGLILEYIQEAIENQKAGKEIKPAKPKKKPLVIHALLQQAFDQDKNLRQAFEDLSLTKKREYAEYISEAKRESTQVKRMEKIVPMILEGVGLNDRYR